MKEALQSGNDLSPYERTKLKAEYENKNFTKNIKLTQDNVNLVSTVYLDYHNGSGDAKEKKRLFDENKRRSIFYKERVLNHKVPLGLDNNPLHLKYTEKG